MAELTPSQARLGVFSALVFGAWLRVGALGREGLWLDELFTLRVATRESWAAMVEDLSRDVHPVGYFSLLRLLSATNPTDAQWRLPSALAGVGTLLLAAWLTRRWAGSTAAVGAAWLVATAPGLVLLDREARPNALLACLGMALVGAVAGRRRVWLIALVSAALVHVHLFGLFVIAGVLAWSLTEDAPRRPVFGGALLGVATLLPWAQALSGQVSAFTANPWYTLPSADSVAWIVTELHDGRPAILALVLGGLLLAVLRRDPASERAVPLAVVMMLALVVLPQLVSYELAPILRPRSAVLVVPLVGVVAAIGFAGSRAGMAMLTLLTVSQAVVSWRATRVDVRMEQWREAAAVVRKEAGPDDLIVANHPVLWRHYLGEDRWIFDADAPALDAAAGLWVLLGHEADAPAALAPLLDGAPVLSDTPLFGARVRRLGPVSVPLRFVAAPDAPASVDGAKVEIWAVGEVTTEALRVRGVCAVEVLGSEDPAGTEHARVRVRLDDGDATVIDEQLPLGAELAPVRTAETSYALFGEPGRSAVRVRVAFLNDAVVDGRDRNVHLAAVRLRCR